MSSNDPSQNYAADNQAWNYDDGRTKMQMTSSRQAWTSTSSTPAPSLMSLPPMLGFGLQDLHSQVHNTAMAHHMSAMQQFQSTAGRLMSGQNNTILGSSHQAAQHGQQLLKGTDTDSSSSEDSDSENTKALQPYADKQSRREQEKLARRMRREESNQQSVQLAREVSARTNDSYALLTSLSNQYKDEQGHRRRQEQRHEEERAELRQLGASMDKRVRDLEDKEAKSRAQAEEKAQEMLRLRQENAKLNRDRLEESSRHRQELADLSRLHASRSSPSVNVDTSAIERLVREVQTNQLSKRDIEKIIQDRVSSQLDGIARSKDVEAATSKMQKALESVPAGASAEQVERAVTKELGKAVDRLADRVQSTTSGHHARLLENHQADVTTDAGFSSRKSKDRRPQDDAKPIMPSSASHARPSSSKQPLQISSVEITELPDDYPDRAGQVSSYERRKKDKKPVSTMTPIDESVADYTVAKSAKHDRSDDGRSHVRNRSRAEAEGKKSEMRAVSGSDAAHLETGNALVRAGGRSKEPSDNASKSRTKMVPSSAIDTSKKIRALPAPEKSTGSSTALQRSKPVVPSITVIEPDMPESSMDRLIRNTAKLNLPDDFPNRASQVSGWERSRESKSKDKAKLIESSPARQISGASNNVGDSKELVRSKKR